MEGALLAPLPVGLLLFMALPAVGWLTTSAPRPSSTAPQVGLGGRNRPLLCRDLRESRGCPTGPGLAAERERGALPDAGRGGYH